jgi:transcriptional regulator with XRE-family HTH domain
MKQHIYPILASQRRRLGLSQQELAARVGLRREKVNRVESKGEDVSFEEMWRLLDAVGLELVIREKDEALVGSSFPDSSAHLASQQFSNNASLIDGSRAKILNWGKVPK